MRPYIHSTVCALKLLIMDRTIHWINILCLHSSRYAYHISQEGRYIWPTYIKASLFKDRKDKSLSLISRCCTSRLYAFLSQNITVGFERHTKRSKDEEIMTENVRLRTKNNDTTVQYKRIQSTRSCYIISALESSHSTYLPDHIKDQPELWQFYWLLSHNEQFIETVQTVGSIQQTTIVTLDFLVVDCVTTSVDCRCYLQFKVLGVST